MIVIKEISHHRVWMIDLISTPIVIAITLCIFQVTVLLLVLGRHPGYFGTRNVKGIQQLHWDLWCHSPVNIIQQLFLLKLKFTQSQKSESKARAVEGLGESAVISQSMRQTNKMNKDGERGRRIRRWASIAEPAWVKSGSSSLGFIWSGTVEMSPL